MAHAPEWIELYTILEAGGDPPAELVERCKAGRTEHTGETMLFWYALEGDPGVVRRLIDLGFDVDTPDMSGSTPIQAAARIARWEMVRVLRDAGARRTGVDSCGMSYRSSITDAGDEVPPDLRVDSYHLADLLDPGGPEPARVIELFITRAGMPPDCPGRPLDREAWFRFASEDSELERTDDDEDFTASSTDGEYAGSLSFDDNHDLDGAAGVVVYPATDAALHAAYRIAKHFGARVRWNFECGPTPDEPRD